MFHFRRKNLIGLDIDTHAIRMIQLRHDDDGYAVTGACEAEIAPWGDDPELRRIHTIRAIQQGIAQCGIDSKLAVCGLRGPEVVVRGFEFPTLPTDEISSAVGLEASQICPFSTDESAFDYQVTSTDVRKTRGFWVAANNTLIRSTRQLVHDAGLHCTILDVDGLALLNCLGNTENEGQETADGKAPRNRPAVLDVGGACTTVAIMDQAGRPFVRDIGSGGDQILRRMAMNAGVPLETARATLLNRRLECRAAGSLRLDIPDPQSQDPPDLWDSLEPACVELVEDIATTLRYYAAQHGSGSTVPGAATGSSCARVEKLLVCGAFSGVEELIDLLRVKLYVDVVPWNPVATMPCEGDQECQMLLQEDGASMALAAGLAMRHL